jgi:hypothetical protein
LEFIQLKPITNRYFAFLRRLRAGGRSNMYGAIPYLAAAFGLDREQAFRIVCEWLDAEKAVEPVFATSGQTRGATESAAPAPQSERRHVVRTKSSRRSAHRKKSSGRRAA